MFDSRVFAMIYKNNYRMCLTERLKSSLKAFNQLYCQTQRICIAHRKERL